jgi:hypothetical protein
MKWCVFILFSILLAGCGVSSFKAQNWNTSVTNDIYRSKNLDICRHQALLALPKTSFDENNNIFVENPNKYANFNKTSLKSCMEAKGYNLRNITSEEIFLNVITMPFELPLMMVGKNLDDTY